MFENRCPKSSYILYLICCFYSFKIIKIFDCDSSFKLNEVILADVKKVNGETIAVLKYNIVEYVKGNFNSPFFGNEGGQKETMMKFTHQGIAEFSVDKGRWLTYDGIMNLQATGVMTANKKTKFTLINASR